MKFSLLIAPALFYMAEAHAGNAYTGQIVIDGQIISGSSNVIKGSGIKHTIKKRLKSFTVMTVEGSFDVIYQHGSPSTTITGDDNIIEHVVSSVTNSTLTLSIDKSYSSQQPIVINVFSQNIRLMTLEGAGTVKLDDIKTDQLAIRLLGTGDVEATGKARALNLTIKGVGDVLARHLEADAVNVNLDGTGDIEVTAHANLQANITGVGNIIYFGSPQEISRQISGVGDIEAGE